MAGELETWLRQRSVDWNAKQPTVRTTGEAVPFLEGDVPDVLVPAGQEFRIIGLQADPELGTVALSWRSEVGFAYHVEVSTDLGAWQRIGSTIRATRSTTDTVVNDPGMRQSADRYYRVVLLP